MILSYKHNFLFTKATKVAGTSMELALSKFCGEDDIITRLGNDEGLWQGRETQNVSFAPYQPLSKNALRQIANKSRIKRGKFLPHTTSTLMYEILGKELWDKLLKWTIIRSPFDRALSKFSWIMRKEPNQMTIENFQQWLLTNKRYNAEDYFWMHNKSPQKNPDGSYKRALDFYVRYEHFEEDLTELSQRLNLPENIWDVFKNIKTKHKIRPQALSIEECFKGFPEGIAHIEKYAEPILTTFGYESPKA